MNMQTQIDLFPLGTCYYSQILISLQIPPVPTAPPPPDQDHGYQEAGALKRTATGEGVCEAPPEGSAKRRDQRFGPEEPEVGRAGSPSRSKLRAANPALLSCPGQFTAWHCSSGRGGGNRPCYTWEGKPTCFQLSPNQPRDYDRNKSVSASTPAPGSEAASSRQLYSARQLARVYEHSLAQPTHPLRARPPTLSTALTPPPLPQGMEEGT